MIILTHKCIYPFLFLSFLSLVSVVGFIVLTPKSIEPNLFLFSVVGKLPIIFIPFNFFCYGVMLCSSNGCISFQVFFFHSQCHRNDGVSFRFFVFWFVSVIGMIVQTPKSIYPIPFYCVLFMVSVVGTIVQISKFIEHFLFLAFLLLVYVVGLIVQTPKSI